MAAAYWQKLGLLYSNPGRHPKLATHTANPLPVHLSGDVYRVFFSGRDAHNRSSVGAVDIDIVRRAIVREYDSPFATHGARGSFCADGISLGNCYEVDGQRYLLFMGWQNPPRGHWRGDIGRMALSPEGRLDFTSDSSFLDSDSTDPISLSYPWILPRPGRGFDMWYGSTVTWDAGNGEMLHVINHATSDDGHVWQRHGLAVPFILNRMQAFSRPTVARRDDGSADMWFSCRGARGDTYRIGHATSLDGRAWRLLPDASEIEISRDGWDSEMIEYPFVLHHAGSCYMLYNGNGYGKTGFGLALRVPG